MLKQTFFASTLICFLWVNDIRCYADTLIQIKHPGASEYRWYADGELVMISDSKVFLMQGDWPYSPEVSHSFTAVDLVDEGGESMSSFESAPYFTKIRLPEAPKIDSVKITLTVGM